MKIIPAELFVADGIEYPEYIEYNKIFTINK